MKLPNNGETVYQVVRHDGKIVAVADTRHNAAAKIPLHSKAYFGGACEYDVERIPVSEIDFTELSLYTPEDWNVLQLRRAVR